MQYSEIHSLKSTGDCIDCLVTFDDLGVLPFTASAVDTSEHGKKIWSDIQAGVWGPIEPETGDKEFLASEIDAENEAIKRVAFQAELDARMEAAVAVASPLDYANKRKKLPVDKAVRLAAFNTYIDQLAALEYSEAVEWPVQPE